MKSKWLLSRPLPFLELSDISNGATDVWLIPYLTNSVHLPFCNFVFPVEFALEGTWRKAAYKGVVRIRQVSIKWLSTVEHGFLNLALTKPRNTQSVTSPLSAANYVRCYNSESSPSNCSQNRSTSVSSNDDQLSNTES